jgi:hypothetical protein
MPPICRGWRRSLVSGRRVHGTAWLPRPEKTQRRGVRDGHRTWPSHLVSQGVSAPLWTNLPSRTE